MLAIVETCGKQYQIQEGRYIDVEFLGKDENETLEFDKVVMIVAGEQSKVGQPYVEGAIVKATVLKNGKEKKVLVYKQRRKKGYRNKNGHRQQFSRIMIESIEFPGKADIIEAAPVEEKPKKAKSSETSKEKTKTKKASKEAAVTEEKPKKAKAVKEEKVEEVVAETAQTTEETTTEEN